MVGYIRKEMDKVIDAFHAAMACIILLLTLCFPVATEYFVALTLRDISIQDKCAGISV